VYVNEGTLTIGACPILRYQQYSRDSHGPVGGAGLQTDQRAKREHLECNSDINDYVNYDLYNNNSVCGKQKTRRFILSEYIEYSGGCNYHFRH